MRQVTMGISCCGTTNSMWSQYPILLSMNLSFSESQFAANCNVCFLLGLKLAALYCSCDQSNILRSE